MKKLVSLLLTLALLLSVSAAFAEAPEMEGNVYLTGPKIVEEPEQLRIFVIQHPGYPSGFEGIKQVERWEKETNIDIIWETIPASAWAERKATMIAGDDLPDIIAGGGVSDDEMAAWGAQGLLVELTPYLEYMPNFQEILKVHPEYLEQIKLADGSIYGFGHGAVIDFGERGDLLYVHEDWLKAAGLDYPIREEKLHRVLDVDLTIDEFTDMLYAFKEIAPENGYALSGNYGDNAFDELYGVFGRVDNNKHIVVEDGEVIFTAAQEEWKNAVNYFAGLYADGIIDPEYFSQDGSTYLAKAAQEMPLFGVGLTWTAHQYDNSMGEAYDKWILVKPIADEDGNQTWLRSYSGIAGGIFCITKDCENVLTAVRFQDYLYDPDNSMQLSLGEYGTSCVKNEDGTIDMLTYSDPNALPTGLNMMFIGTPEMFANVRFADPTQMTVDVGMEYRKYQPEERQEFPPVKFTPEQQEAISRISADILPFVSQMQAEWITGGGVDDEAWEAYLEQLKDMKVDEYVEIYQERLDAME